MKQLRRLSNTLRGRKKFDLEVRDDYHLLDVRSSRSITVGGRGKFHNRYPQSQYCVL